MSAIANPNPADPHYKKVLTELFPEAERGKDAALRIFELILSNDTNALSEWIATDTANRVNATATKMLLHPLHVCAMTGNLECAMILTQSGCAINPQDASGATPLHHAAVRNHQAMIAFFLGKKAQMLPDRFGGTYLNVLRQVQEPKPEAQIFYYKNEEGKIVKGNGIDFLKMTETAFLDKECRISPEEWLKLWQGEAQKSEEEPLSLGAQYEAFYKLPPLLYLERHPKVGLNVCSGQDIQPGMVVGEYLGDIQKGASLISLGGFSAEEVKEKQREKEYIFGNINATHFRGIAALCNDSFPNVRACHLYNKKGIPVRTLLVAIQPIKKGESIVYSYGVGHNIRMEQRKELRREAFFQFFKNNCANGFIDTLNQWMGLNDSAILEGRLLEGEQNMGGEAMAYIFTTPAAALSLFCENKAILDDFKMMLDNPQYLSLTKKIVKAKIAPEAWARLENFYRTAFQYFDKLKTLPKKEKSKAINRLKGALETSDGDALITMMGGDPQAYILQANQAALNQLLGTLVDELKKATTAPVK